MTAAAERTVLLAAAVAVVLLLCVGLGAAFLSAEWLPLYTPALALPVLAQGLATGLRWGSTDLINEVAVDDADAMRAGDLHGDDVGVAQVLRVGGHHRPAR